MTDIYGLRPFPSVIDKAAALMYSIAVFHPFSDGNKRTALLAAFFFLYFNGYQFEISNDAVDFLIKIGNREIKDEKIVAEWLRKRVHRPLLLRIFAQIVKLEGRNFVVTPEMVRSKVVGLSLLDIAIRLLEFTKKIWPPK
jgi:hypothetical protein